MHIRHLTEDGKEDKISEDNGIIFLLPIQFHKFPDHRDGVSDVIEPNQPHDANLIDLLDAGNLHLHAQLLHTLHHLMQLHNIQPVYILSCVAVDDDCDFLHGDGVGLGERVFDEVIGSAQHDCELYLRLDVAPAFAVGGKESEKGLQIILILDEGWLLVELPLVHVQHQVLHQSLVHAIVLQEVLILEQDVDG